MSFNRSYSRLVVFSLILAITFVSALVQPPQRVTQAQDGLTEFQARYGDLAAASQSSGGASLQQSFGEPTLEMPYFDVKEITGRNAVASLWQAFHVPSEADNTAHGLAAPVRKPPLRPTLDFSFKGYDLNYAATIYGYYTPPDTMGVVGPTEFMITQNGLYRVFDKETGEPNMALDIAAPDFWPDSVDPTDDAGGDPRVRFDRLTDRWVVSAFTLNRPGGYIDNRLVFAISDGPTLDAGTVWTYYYVDPVGTENNCFIDYPTLGVDVNALYFAANMFSCSGSGYPGNFNVTAWVMPKSLLPPGGGNVTGIISAFTDLYWTGLAYSVLGADNYDPFATQGYFIAQNAAFDEYLTLITVNDPGTTPSISLSYILINDKNDGWSVGVPYPGNVVPAGGGCPAACDWGLDPLGFRPLSAAHVRDGSLWTVISSSVNGPTGDLRLWPATGDRHSVIMFEIDLATETPIQDFNIYDAVTPLGGTPEHYFMGAVTVSGQGHAVVGFTATDTDSLAPSSAYAARLRTDPLNTISTAEVFWEGTDTGDVRQSFETSNRRTRWGDYSMTSLDPCDDQTFYTIQEFQARDRSPYGGNWGVAVARIQAPPPPAQLAGSEPIIAGGQAAVAAFIEGDPARVALGEEYYNTPRYGMSESCRQKLEVTIIGGSSTGAVINGLDNWGIDEVVVSFDTTAATTGDVLLQICNPDGQCTTAVVFIEGGLAPGLAVSDPAISKVGVLQPGGLGLVGEQITWTITVTNTSGVTASNVVVTDTVPSDLRIDSVNTSKGTSSVSGQTVTFTIGSMAPGETVTMQIVTTVMSSPLGSVLSNTATVTGIGTASRSATGTVNLVTGLPSTGYPPSGN